jgi:hypothetical protein
MLNAQQNQPKMPSAFPTIITQVLSHLASFVKVSPFGKPRECYDKNQSEKHVYRQPFVPDLDAHPRVLKQQKEKEDVVTEGKMKWFYSPWAWALCSGQKMTEDEIQTLFSVLSHAGSCHDLYSDF